MRKYLLKRVLQMIPVFLGITLISFMIIHLAPGGPTAVLGGLDLNQEQVEALTKTYGFDQPLPVQYARWVGKMVQGDFGKSYVENRSVVEMIKERLPNTVYLNLFSILLIYLIAVPVGVISAIRQYSKFDYTVTVAAFAGDAMPSFFLALLAIYLIALPSGGAIPLGGIASYGMKLEKVGLLAFLMDRGKYMFLPLLVIVLHGLTGITRYMRSSMLEVIKEDYIRTARSKGLPERIVVYKHALRNALIPLVTIAGNIIPGMFGGSVIIEQIFSWPGLGWLSYRAVLQRDFPVVMAFLTVGSVLTLISFLVVDIIYVYVDPRIKYS